VSDWDAQPLGELATNIGTGSTPSTAHQEFFGGIVQWFTPGDIGNAKKLVASSRTITPEALANGKVRLFEKASLLVTCIGEIGRVGILQQPSSSNQQITAIKFGDDIDENFAYYWFVANRNQLERRANLALVPILNNERLKEIVFSYPPLPEQRRIAARLDKADRLRRTRRYAAQLSDTFLQAVFVRMFGEPVTNLLHFPLEKLEDLIDPDRQITYGIVLPGDNVEGGVPYVRVVDMKEGQINSAGLRRTTRAIADSYKRSSLKPGDLLLSIRGQVGRLAIVPKNLDGANITQDTARLATTEKINVLYLMGCLDSAEMQEYMRNLIKGAAIQGINLGDVKEFMIPVPPLALQEKFARIVQQFERLRAQQREAERQAEHLFQTLLHRAFGGEG